MNAPTGTSGPAGAGSVTVVLDASGLLWASQQHRVEAGLAAQPGVRAVEANAVAQTVTVGYDPTETSVTALRRFVTDCGLHCAGQSVPHHLCDPAAEPVAMTDLTGDGGPAPSEAAGAAGHGVQHGHDMAAMVADMRNRFLVAAVFSLPILLWSPIGRDVFGFTVGAPFGLRDDVWQLLLS